MLILPQIYHSRKISSMDNIEARGLYVVGALKASIIFLYLRFRQMFFVNLRLQDRRHVYFSPLWSPGNEMDRGANQNIGHQVTHSGLSDLPDTNTAIMMEVNFILLCYLMDLSIKLMDELIE